MKKMLIWLQTVLKKTEMVHYSIGFKQYLCY